MKKKVQEHHNRVIHVTTVHPWWDNRIYEKMVSMLPKMGWDVCYIAQCADPVPKLENISFIPLCTQKGIFGRLRRNWAAFRACLTSNIPLIHFHDPEFLPFAFILRLMGKKIIYDVHEDNFLGMQQKEYLPFFISKMLAYATAIIENISSHMLVIVLAERVYLNRFPKGHLILNYFKKSDHNQNNDEHFKLPSSANTKLKRMIYTGCISVDRGAYNHVDLLQYLPDYELYMVGKCDDNLKNELIERAGKASERLHLDVSTSGVPYSEIEKYYRIGGWEWGLAVFPYTRHYYEKELTKFYEYMCFNIPIACSNFPVWQKLVQGYNIGVVLDSCDLVSAAHTINAIKQEQRDGICCSISDIGSEFLWEGELEKLVAIYGSLHA